MNDVTEYARFDYLPMDIDEAAVIVQGPRCSRRDQAIHALLAYVEQRARKERLSVEEAEDVASEIVLKILPKLDGGELPWDPGHHRGFLATCARNAALNRRRARARYQRLEPDELSEQPPDSGSEVNEQVAAARALVERVAAAARTQRAVRYRPAFDRAFAQVRALALEDADLRSLLESDGTVPTNADEVAWQKARDSAYKAHQRVRDELSAAVELLHRSGALTTAEAALARRILRCFVRCQRTAASGVSIQEGAS